MEPALAVIIPHGQMSSAEWLICTVACVDDVHWIVCVHVQCFSFIAIVLGIKRCVLTPNVFT